MAGHASALCSAPRASEEAGWRVLGGSKGGDGPACGAVGGVLGEQDVSND